LRRIILNNYRYKIVAVVIATLLWWFIYTEHNPQYQADITVPIQYQNLPASLMIEKGPEVVRLSLRGESVEVNDPDKELIKAMVDLAGLQEGEHTLDVQIINNTAAKVLDRSVSIDITLKELPKIELPVRLKFEGMLPLGLKLMQGRNRFWPTRVSLYGDEELLSMANHVMATINLTDRHKSFREKVPLEAADETGSVLRDIRINPPTIEAEIFIEKESVKVVPVVLRYKRGYRGSESEKVDLFPKVVSLVGDEEVLNDIASVSTEEFDYSLCSEADFVSLLLVYPQTVTSSVERVTVSCEPPSEIARSFGVKAKVINLCEGCRCTKCELSPQGERIWPSNIEVVTTGPSADVNNISYSDISAVVDLLGLEPGSHEVKVHVSLKAEAENVSITNVKPGKVNITIESEEE